MSGTCFLELYAKSILALEARGGQAGVRIPFAIMTSDDTHARTVALLEQHALFGLAREQARAAPFPGSSLGLILCWNGEDEESKLPPR